ncbi:hypothetical protein [uncultured Mediterranean phage uvMED]|nr:hypothetical protein [uncultured Mediterranean phage uvMED]
MNKQPTISDAIYALGIDGGWKIKAGKIVKWYSEKEQPADDVIQAKLKELEDEYEKQAYSRSRKQEYPDLQECIHALLDGGDTLTELQTKRSEIKQKYPKPT